VYQHFIRAGGFDEEVTIFCKYGGSQDLYLLFFMTVTKTYSYSAFLFLHLRPIYL